MNGKIFRGIRLLTPTGTPTTVCGGRTRFRSTGNTKEVSSGEGSEHSERLAENLTQAVACDFLKLGCIRAEKAGYEPVTMIHDQLLTAYYPERENTVDGLVDALCALPPWAPDFPLAAVGNLAPFYRKD